MGFSCNLPERATKWVRPRATAEGGGRTTAGGELWEAVCDFELNALEKVYVQIIYSVTDKLVALNSM